MQLIQYDEDGTGDRKTMSGDRDTIRKSVRASKGVASMRDSRASGYGASIIGALARLLPM